MACRLMRAIMRALEGGRLLRRAPRGACRHGRSRTSPRRASGLAFSRCSSASTPAPPNSPAPTAYMYSTYETPFAGKTRCEADPSEREKIVILGGGPNRIGQGIEFDYCCCHASFALSEAGYETIMINCNPETVSTDYDTSDRLYFEPLTAEDVLAILDKERERGLAQGRDRSVRRPDAAEARPRASNRRARRSSALPSTRSISPRTATASSGCSTSSASSSRRTASPIRSSRRAWSPPISACRWWCARPMCWAAGRWRSSTIGARSTTICSACCRAWCRPTSRRATRTTRPARSTRCSARTRCCSTAIWRTRSRSTSTRSCDGKTVFVAGIMEHIEEAGIHSGDSACSLPPRSLTPETIARARGRRRRSWRCALEVGGLMNVQYALKDGDDLRARGQSARLAHGAVRRQGDRQADRQDRRPHHGGRELASLRSQARASSTMSGSRRRCFRSPASPASTRCSGRRCARPAR